MTYGAMNILPDMDNKAQGPPIRSGQTWMRKRTGILFNISVVVVNPRGQSIVRGRDDHDNGPRSMIDDVLWRDYILVKAA